jgi:hypothetical protein
VILSKVIFHQFLEEVQATKIRSSKLRSHPRKILLDLHPLKSLSEGVAQNFLKREEFSWLSKSKFHFLRNSQSKWAISLHWFFITFYLLLQAYKSSWISLKRAWVFRGQFCLFRQNWTVWFHKPNYPVFMGLTTRTELTPSSILSLHSLILSRTTLRMPARPSLAISWLLFGFLKFLGGFNSPRTGVSDSPTGFFSS